MAKLFDKKLKALLNKPQEKTVVYSDGNGLGARISPLGGIRWQFRYKVEGKNKRVDLGDYPELSIHKAREMTKQYRSWLAEGVDPKLQRELVRSSTLKPVTVKDALEYWLVEYGDDNRTNVEKHRQQFQRHIYPYIGLLPLERVDTRHWIECFARIRKGIPNKQKAAPHAASYILRNAKQALKYCRVTHFACSRALDDLTESDVGKKSKPRDRVLIESELIDLLIEIETGKFIPPYYRNLAKFLITFGSRTQEVRLSFWKEWDFESMLWTVPAEHTKNNKKIVRPIPEGLVSWLLSIKQDAGGDERILGELKTTEAVSQYGRCLWKRFNHNEKWTLHDLRRSFVTYLNDYGVEPYIAELLAGHSLSGVMAVYNHSQYLDKKGRALAMWLEHLNMLSHPSENVTSILASKKSA
ncbi:TPA: integrase arm-type DNA-binding domain-containing protein [Vibrio campbellii]|nr:integrase arm-type DNA-binding domain-containing protein [Vibrio campbellii]